MSDTAIVPPSLAQVAARSRIAQPVGDRPPKIQSERLNFFYGETRALADISIAIHPNIVTAFIGPSGCGKSTFLRTLNRMNDIIPGTRVEGKVLIDDVGHLRSGRRRGRAAAAGGDGVPEVEPVPEVDLRQRRVRARGSTAWPGAAPT